MKEKFETILHTLDDMRMTEYNLRKQAASPSLIQVKEYELSLGLKIGHSAVKYAAQEIFKKADIEASPNEKNTHLFIRKGDVKQGLLTKIAAENKANFMSELYSYEKDSDRDGISNPEFINAIHPNLQADYSMYKDIEFQVALESSPEEAKYIGEITKRTAAYAYFSDDGRDLKRFIEVAFESKIEDEPEIEPEPELDIEEQMERENAPYEAVQSAIMETLYDVQYDLIPDGDDYIIMKPSQHQRLEEILETFLIDYEAVTAYDNEAIRVEAAELEEAAPHISYTVQEQKAEQQRQEDEAKEYALKTEDIQGVLSHIAMAANERFNFTLDKQNLTIHSGLNISTALITAFEEHGIEFKSENQIGADGFEIVVSTDLFHHHYDDIDVHATQTAHNLANDVYAQAAAIGATVNDSGADCHSAPPVKASSKSLTAA